MIEAKNLCFSYGSRKILEALNFEVSKPSLVHVRGSNGCGKSTLLSLISGGLKPRSGSLRVEDSLKADMDALHAEHNGHFLGLGALENLSFWQNLKRQTNDKDAQLRVLNTWGLNSPWIIKHSLPVEKFSTGMKRRLALARVDLLGSKLLLLDEPFFGLDEKAVELFVNFLARQKQTMTWIVSHDPKPFEGLIEQTLDLGVKS